MELKSSKSFEEQLEILKSRNLKIDNWDDALETLSNVNYYNLTGYLFPFKGEDEKYQTGVTFEQIIALYNFDKEMHSLILFLLTEIEQTLKTKIVNSIALAYPEDPCIYEKEEFFKNPTEYQKFIKDFSRNIRNNKGVDFVKHHINKYEGKFPIWVAVELFTLGNIKYLHKNISNQLRKQISSQFNISPIILDDWIESLRILRNLSAHNMRLYGYTFKDAPKLSAIGYHENIDNRLFGQFLLLKYLYFDKENWNQKMNQLEDIISKSKSYVELGEIGFPEDWKSILSNKNSDHVIRR